MNVAEYIFELMVMSLAAWRISVFVTHERGPFGFMVKIRGWFDVEHDDTGTITSQPSSGIGQLLTCVWCFSWWAILFVAAIAFFISWLPVFLLAAWGMVGIIQRFVIER